MERQVEWKQIPVHVGRQHADNPQKTTQSLNTPNRTSTDEGYAVRAGQEQPRSHIYIYRLKIVFTLNPAPLKYKERETERQTDRQTGRQRENPLTPGRTERERERESLSLIHI